MKSRIPACGFSAISIGFSIAFAVSGFSSVGCAFFAFVSILLAIAMEIDYEKKMDQIEERRKNREAIQLLRNAENFEMLCQIEEERNRRHIMDAAENATI